MSVRDRRTLSQLCDEVEACVDASGVVGMIEAVLPATGRPRELPVRTFLVGMLLAVRYGFVPQLEKARLVLTELPRHTKERLGVIRDDGTEITYKQMADMFDRIARALDTSPHFYGADLSVEEKAFRDDLLVELTDKLLAASIPADVPHKGSYSIDGTNIDSFAHPTIRVINHEEGCVAISHLPDDDPRKVKWLAAQQSRRQSRSQSWPDPAAVRPHDAQPPQRKTRISTTHIPKPNPRRRRFGVADPDSSRYERDGWKRDGKYGFGMEMHSFVMVAEEGDPSIPPFTRHFRLTPHQPSHRKIVVEMAERITDLGGSASDIVYDAGYAQYTEINAGLRRAGFNPVFDLSPNHRGVTGAVAGAIVVDGGLYSPGLPQALRNLNPPPVGASVQDIDHYQQLIAERQRYALRRLGAAPGPDGTVRYQCPASARRVACPLKPASLRIATQKGIIVPTNVPAPGAQGDICRQSTVTIDLHHPDALTRAMGYVGGLYQKHPVGSDAWYDSMRRRSYAESAFANIKSEANQNLRRPSIRVMGRTKMTLIAAFVTAAANLRMGRLWTLRQHRARQANNPPLSPAMREAAKARRRAEGRRRRQERQQAQRKARGRPPG